MIIRPKLGNRAWAQALSASLMIAATAPAKPRPDMPPVRLDGAAAGLSSQQQEAVERIAAVEGISSAGVFENTGVDNCADVQAVSLPGNLPGETVTVTILGDNTPATGPDCDTGGTLWWEAFDLTGCATVRLDYCGTDPTRSTVNTFLYRDCPGDAGECAERVNFASGGPGQCSDGNFTLFFSNLAPGRYYIPIRSGSESDRGPYQINLFAVRCVGSCCDFAAGTCTDGVLDEQCAAPDQEFSAGQTCCTRECLAPGETFRSDGVELLSWVDLSQFPNGQFGANDVWGYASPARREYAIIGLNLGTGFVEVTDPFNATVVATIGDPLSIWSDMRTLGHYAYNVVDGSGDGLQIFDLAQIDSGVVTLVDTFTGGGFQEAHNIAVNTETEFGYLCGTNITSGFVAIDLTSPTAPTIAGSWNEASCHDLFVISYIEGPFAGREIAFLFGTGDHFYIIDVTDKQNMFTVASLPQIPTGFGHQGWITEDRRYVIMGSELTNGAPTTTFVNNVENIESPFFVNTYTTGLCSTDHNMMIRAGLAYHANYSSGLQVFDVTDPPNAQRVAFFDTHPEDNERGFAGAWGVFTQLPSGITLISDDERGLFVLNYDCNGNGVDDTMDIADATSNDCNANGLPDECERDADGNGQPDDCEFAAQTPPQPEPGGIAKNRFLSFVVPPLDGAPQATALRVELTSLHHPAAPPDAPDLTAHEGEFRYVAPFAFDDDTGEPVLDCVNSAAFGTTFNCARLVCDPVYLDWSSKLLGEVLHITGTAVVPSSQYKVAMLAETCAGAENSCTSVTADLIVLTNMWGDVDPISGGLNITDVVTIVDSVKQFAGAMSRVSTELQPHDPDVLRVGGPSVLDVTAGVDALKGFPYPFSGPDACP